MNVKQVIVVRKDLKMRRGKEIAQGSHASMAWLTRRIQDFGNGSITIRGYDEDGIIHNVMNSMFSYPERQWLFGSFAKVTLQVDNEEDLREVYKQAKAAGLEASLIIDSGKTEFDGVPTATAVAIGPDEVEKLDQITGKDSPLSKAGKVKLY